MMSRPIMRDIGVATLAMGLVVMAVITAINVIASQTQPPRLPDQQVTELNAAIDRLHMTPEQQADFERAHLLQKVYGKNPESDRLFERLGVYQFCRSATDCSNLKM